MKTQRTVESISRRTALAGIGASGMALAASRMAASASSSQVAPPAAKDYSSHPLTGTWLVMTPGGPNPAIFAADGSFIQSATISYVDQKLGVVLRSAGCGSWEPMGERGSRFTNVSVFSDVNGKLLGSITFSGHPEVGEDGDTFTDTSLQRVIIRDVANKVVSDDTFTVEGVSATRIKSDAVVFPGDAATPVA